VSKADLPLHARTRRPWHATAPAYARAFAGAARVAWLLALTAAALGCNETSRSPAQASRPAAESPADDVLQPPPQWAVQVGRALADTQLRSGRRVEPASMHDRGYDSQEPVPVRRLVYRVKLEVPPGLRASHPPLLPSSGELHLDVGLERLRARFVGQGWPVDDGSEVRLRSDLPGVYVFDAKGGRPLAPGQLAGWFQGEEAERRRFPLRVRRDTGPTLDGPSELVCALLAEWTDQPRAEIVPRCSDGALPPSFGFGLWSAELTAIVPMTMLRFQLRADAVDLPRGVTTSPVRGLLDPRDAARLPPTPPPPPPGSKSKSKGKKPVVEPAPSPPLAANAVLRVDNPTSARALVVVQGVPVAWLKPGAVAEFGGFVPGRYRVGAARPFGQSAVSPSVMEIPGEITLGHPVAEEPQLETPLPTDSPEAAR